MGKRSKRARQEELWMATASMVETPGHAFYDRLNEVLVEHDFDQRIEHLCQRYYRGALVHGSEFGTDPPSPRAKITPLGSCPASRGESSC